MKAEEAKKVRKLEEENKRLRRLLAAAELDNAILRESLGEIDMPCTPQGSGQPRPAEAGRQRALACRVLGRPRQRQCCWPLPTEFERGLPLRRLELARDYPRYGYRRIWTLLRREDGN